MIYTVHNTSASPRVFYDTQKTEITIKPGDIKLVDLDEGTYTQLWMRQDIIIKPSSFERYAPYEAAPIAASKPALSITGHFGIGDNLHQRAVMRELMKDHDIWLHTCHFELYHDLVQQGLKLVMRPTSLHAQAKTISRERDQFAKANFPSPPRNARSLNIGYPKQLIDQHGSILESMFGCVGLKMPEHPDFSLPIKPEWRKDIQGALLQWNPNRKPLLIHRPIVVRNEWDGRSRNPDLNAYDKLFRSIRDRYFVVSVADLATGREWIDGPQQDADIKLHSGELSFPEMAALFAEADLIFCNAGFAPVLAQAVGTPVVVVYGGRESYRTTQRVGAYLAPILPIDPINPCDCHSNQHACDKRIDLPVAMERLRFFVQDRNKASTLIFGTFFVDSPDRKALTELWEKLHLRLNFDCDFLAIDSQSPIKMFADWTPYDGKRHDRMYFNFNDNIGHLSRKTVTQGRDGWGRAFCKGLEVACELGYDYAVHIEGDSLFRLNVSEITRWMKANGVDCASTDVSGMLAPGLDKQWIETGLMFFSTNYIKRSNFITRYDWPNRRSSPTPERYIRQWILSKDLNDRQFRTMPWKALRADKNQITKDNIEQLDLDWITHQHDSAQQGVYQRFVEMALGGAGSQPATQPATSADRQPGVATGPSIVKEVMPNKPDDRPTLAAGPNLTKPCIAKPYQTLPDLTGPRQARTLSLINLGCGRNLLPGWENHDADMDITKVLPWPDESASYIFAEHVVEHIPYKTAIAFFKEAYRVLAPGGCLRITVPSLEQIARCEETDYHRFTMKWQPLGPTKRGAMHAIIYAHGHETVWNAQLLHDTLYFAGFDDVRRCQNGQSDDPVLCGVEGHGRVIGDKFNRIESCTCEARKTGQLIVAPPETIIVDTSAVALVIGGAECWQHDLEEAKKLLAGRKIRYFYINDQIKTFPEHGVACTLHPDKLNGHIGWLINRRKAGLPEPQAIWAHRKHAAVTHDTASREWMGSSGLFAVQIARQEGHTKIVACGIPMTVDGSHFERHQKWQSAISFRQGWVKCRNELEPSFRSMSGWTMEQFGRPDEKWLGGI